MSAPRGLLVDFGGVLTGSVASSFRAFERAEGLPKGTILTLLVRGYEHGTEDGLVARVERGELDEDQFDAELLRELAAAGYEVSSGPVVRRLFAGMVPESRMWEVVAQARDAGVRTGLLSNSWGTDSYPDDLLEDHFDAVLISGLEGLRKPDPAFFRLGAQRLGVAVESCAFVDDLDRNVEVACSLGMHGVLHRGDAEATAAALAPFLGVQFSL